MRRREFITLVGGLAATWQFAARAQPTKLHRIGALFVGNADSAAFRAELQQEIRKSGYIEGQNVVFEFRSAEQKLDRLPQLAAELIALKGFISDKFGHTRSGLRPPTKKGFASLSA
jgi:hypothetical protein